MATKYGKILRKIRIDVGEVLGDMAEKIRVSSSYLSSIETGSRNIPIDLTGKICSNYDLDKKTIEQLEEAELENIKEVKVPFLNNASDLSKETAMLFARTFNNANDEEMEKIKELLSKIGGKN